MKNLIFNFLKIFLLINIIIFTLGCPEVFTDDDVGSISGVVTDMNKNPISGVKVIINAKENYSDDKGLFSIDKIPIGKNQVVEFSKPNHVSNQKQATIELNKNTVVYASLGTWDKSETINPKQDNTISFQNAEVKLPANGIIDANGNVFTGNVTVNAAYFDPMVDNYENVFPGDFEGEDISGNTVDIESFGFINVELTDGSQSLNLAKGSTADITIPIPDALKNNAPDPIPLWFFDEELGIWKEEGSASIQNGVYVGTVEHFTAWNCDIGFDISSIKGRVICEDGSPINNALVYAKGIDYAMTNRARTDANGFYEIDVKANAIVDVYASKVSTIGELLNNSQKVRVNTKNANETKTSEDLIINCDTNKYSRLYDVNYDLGFVPIAVGEIGKIIYFNIEIGSWIPLPAGTTQDFYSIAIPSVSNIWVVGSNGVVKQTTDSKLIEWITVNIGTDAHLYDVEFYNSYYGWIVGTTGKIFKTLDGGENWSPVTSGTVQTLYESSFINKDEGWVCGSNGTILHTINGGDSWNIQTSTTLEDLKGIKFVNNQKGWAVGENGKIIRTVNGGQTWFDQSFAGILEDYKGIDFCHLLGGVIVGNNGTVLKTIDGGENWTNESVALKNNLEAVDFIPNSYGQGLVVGDDNVFEIDVGDYPISTGWKSQNSNVSDTLRGINAVSESEAWVVGDAGKVLYTNNSGSDWNLIATGSSKDFHAIDVYGNSIWIGGKDNTLLKSIDNGNSWQTIQTVAGGKTIKKIQCINQDICLVLLEDESISNGKELIKTVDGGLNWKHFNALPGGLENYYQDFLFIDNDKGYVLNFDDTQESMCVYKTIDAGNSWQIEYIYEESNGFVSMCTLNDKELWVLSEGTISHVEEGKKWYSNFHLDVNIIKVEFETSEIGYCLSGYSGDISKSYDGGKSWYSQGDGTGYIRDLNSFNMINENVGWAVGDNGKIYYTTTGGE